MKALEEIDPELIDQTIRRMMSAPRPDDREVAIATHLGESRELMEFIQMILRSPAPDPDLALSAVSMLLSAAAIGMEVGYALGIREGQRDAATPRKQNGGARE